MVPGSGGGGETRPLRCGLISLSAPIDLLLRKVLAPPVEEAAAH